MNEGLLKDVAADALQEGSEQRKIARHLEAMVRRVAPVTLTAAPWTDVVRVKEFAQPPDLVECAMQYGRRRAKIE